MVKEKITAQDVVSWLHEVNNTPFFENIDFHCFGNIVVGVPKTMKLRDAVDKVKRYFAVELDSPPQASTESS